MLALYAYVYVGPVFTGHKRCHAFAYAYVASENQILVIRGVLPYTQWFFETKTLRVVINSRCSGYKPKNTERNTIICISLFATLTLYFALVFVTEWA